MGKKYKKVNGCSEKFDIDLRECKYLGEGHNGIVYLMPDGRAIKIFKKPKNCKKEYTILKRVNGNKHFPRVYHLGGNYIVRDYVDGECIKDYIKSKGFSENLALNLIDLIEEFKRLKFTKLDVRCRDLYVQKDGSLMVIDPKSCYRRSKPYPRHLMKGLNKLGVLDDFICVLKYKKPHIYKQWKEFMESDSQNSGT